LKKLPQEAALLEKLIQGNSFGDYILMSETCEGCGYNCLLEKDVGKSVAVVGKGEELHEGILIKAHIHLKHILFRFLQDALKETQSVCHRYGRIGLTAGYLDSS
jgi:hypothetical protein